MKYFGGLEKTNIQLKKRARYWVMSLAETFRFNKNASIAFDWSNANGLSPNPYTSRKR